MQEGRCQRRRHRHHAGEFGNAQQNADDRHHENADQHRAGHAAGFEADDQEEAEDRQQRLWLAQVAHADHGRRVVDDDAGALQGDQREEQADPRGDGRAQLQRDAVDDPLADLEDRQQEEQARGQEYRAEGHLPGVAHAQHHGVGEESVQAHARRQGDRVVGDQAHHRRAEGRRQAGGDEDRALVHAGFAEDARVDEEDVGHRQEGGETGQHLGAHVGVVRLELEQLFQHVNPLVYRSWPGVSRASAVGITRLSATTAKPIVGPVAKKPRILHRRHVRLNFRITSGR